MMDVDYPIEPKTNDKIGTYYYNFPAGFSREECAAIIRMGDNLTLRGGAVGTATDEYEEVRSIRTVETAMIPLNDSTRWLYDKIRDMVIEANDDCYKFDITGIFEGIQFLRYENKGDDVGHYDWHQDSGPGDASQRKLSFIAQMSQVGEDYEGCETNIFPLEDPISQDQGDAIVFRSDQFHRVQDLKSGVRICIVAWVKGPPLR